MNISTSRYSGLPRYLCYKAALMKEKATLQFVIAVLSAVLGAVILASRIEVSKLQQKLREKEFILAPGVLDFTTASPSTVSDRYIEDAVNNFLATLGNINPRNVTEQYDVIRTFMHPKLLVRFDRETSAWVQQVEKEQISQILSIKEKRITATTAGEFQVVAFAKAELYSSQSFLGFENQAIVMRLRLVPPEDGKRWALQITELTWSDEETYRVKHQLEETMKENL